jgi:ketosteroid isomerase-like protein
MNRQFVISWRFGTAQPLPVMSTPCLVVFLVAGRPPMRGRSLFERGLRGQLAKHRIESTGEVQEVDVSGGLAYCWTELTVRIVPLSGGDSATRAGSALSILRKQASGSWMVVRDANMLPPMS